MVSDYLSVITEEPQCARSFSIDIARSGTKNREKHVRSLSTAKLPLVVSNRLKQEVSTQRGDPVYLPVVVMISVRTSGQFHVVVRFPRQVGTNGREQTL